MSFWTPQRMAQNWACHTSRPTWSFPRGRIWCLVSDSQTNDVEPDVLKRGYSRVVIGTWYLGSCKRLPNGRGKPTGGGTS